MSVKSLSIAEWGNIMVTEPLPTDESLQHLQYYEPGVGGDFPGKITSGAQLGF